MAGGKFSEAQLHGITIRESANDGSDFTNPAADFRRVFLGEDGEWHARDSAGAVTTMGGAVADILDLATAETDDTLVLAPDGAGGVEFRAESGGASGLLAVVQYRPGTQQVFSTTSTSYADVDATNLAITATPPPSGNVLIKLSGAPDIATEGAALACWNLRVGAADVSGTDGGVTSNDDAAIVTRSIYLTGLTPGTPVTWKWGHRTSNGGFAARLIVSDGDPYPPAVMEVWAAP